MSDLDAIAVKCGTDKSSLYHDYANRYVGYLTELKNQQFSLIEIGIGGKTFDGPAGGSLRMWDAYFPYAEIHGIDNDPSCKIPLPERIHVHIGNQDDSLFLDRVMRETQHPLKLVVDDGSHINRLTINTFLILFQRLAPGGLYIIEDTHCTYEKKFENIRAEFNSFALKLMSAVDTNCVKLLEHNIQDFKKIEHKDRLDSLSRWTESVHYHRGFMVIRKRAY